MTQTPLGVSGVSSLPCLVDAVVWSSPPFISSVALSPHPRWGEAWFWEVKFPLSSLVELSRNSFLGRCWTGQAAPHELIFSQGVPSLRPRKGHFTFWLALESCVDGQIPLPKSVLGKGPPETGLQADKQNEHDFSQWGFDLPNVTRQAGDRCQALVIPGSHRRALCRYSHGGASWQAWAWVGAHHN